MAKAYIQPEQVFGEGTEWIRKADKEGGSNSAGELGGVYEGPKGKKALIKKEDNIVFNISEYLGSQLFEAIEPGSGAKVELMVHKSDNTELPSKGTSVYLRSEFFDKYNDLYKETGFGIFKSRKQMMGTREALFKTLSNAFKNNGYTGFEKIAPPSLLMGDFDLHVGNIGVVRDQDPRRLVRIDFAWSLAKLENNVHPNSTSRHKVMQGPTNHYREFPRHLKNTDEFVNGLLKAADTDIDETIDKSFAKLTAFYNQEAMIAWAHHSMPGRFKKGELENVQPDKCVDKIKGQFKEVMLARRESLREYAIQIKLGILAKKALKGEDINKELAGLLKDDRNKNICEEIVSGARKFKFRDRYLRRFGREKKATELIFNNLKEALEQPEKAPAAGEKLNYSASEKQTTIQIPEQKKASNTPATSNVDEKFWEEIKTATTYKQATEKFQDQQKTGNLKPFTKVSEPKVQEDGTALIVYANPALPEAERKKLENQVKYIYKDNRLIDIRVGSKVSCIIPPLPKEPGTGFKMMEIRDGIPDKIINKGDGKTVEIHALEGIEQRMAKGKSGYNSTPTKMQRRNSSPAIGG